MFKEPIAMMLPRTIGSMAISPLGVLTETTRITMVRIVVPYDSGSICFFGSGGGFVGGAAWHLIEAGFGQNGGPQPRSNDLNFFGDG